MYIIIINNICIVLLYYGDCRVLAASQRAIIIERGSFLFRDPIK